MDSSPYWDDLKTSSDFETWRHAWDGSLACACDHGCNQWLKEQQGKASLIFRYKDKPKLLDKIARMQPERAARLAGWLSRREARKIWGGG